MLVGSSSPCVGQFQRVPNAAERAEVDLAVGIDGAGASWRCRASSCLPMSLPFFGSKTSPYPPLSSTTIFAVDWNRRALVDRDFLVAPQFARRNSGRRAWSRRCRRRLPIVLSSRFSSACPMKTSLFDDQRSRLNAAGRRVIRPKLLARARLHPVDRCRRRKPATSMRLPLITVGTGML